MLWKEVKRFNKEVNLVNFVENAVPTRGRTSGGTMINCPLHEDKTPSLYVTDDHAYCFSCHKYFSPYELAQVIGCPPDVTPQVERKPKKLLPEIRVRQKFIEVAHGVLMNMPDKLNYFTKKRRISEGVLRRFKVGYIKPPFRKYTLPRYSFPAWDFDGKLSTVGYRQDPSLDYGDVYPDGQKYVIHTGTRSMIYGAHLLRDYKYVFMCGGQLDALSLLQYGINATGAMGEGVFKEEWVPHYENKRVYVLMDNDEAGRRASQKIKDMMPWAEILTWNERTPEKFDANDLTTYAVKSVPRGIRPNLGDLRSLCFEQEHQCDRQGQGVN